MEQQEQQEQVELLNYFSFFLDGGLMGIIYFGDDFAWIKEDDWIKEDGWIDYII